MLAEPSPRHLDDAVTRRGAGATIAEAVGIHPAAEELESMLALGERLSVLASPTAADPGARVRIRSEFFRAGGAHRSAWVHQHRVTVRRPARHPLPTHHLRWSMVVAIALLAALVAGVTLALATQLAEPDSPLYGLKQSSESLLVAVNRTPTSKAGVRVQIATQRFRDAEAMAAKGDGPLTVRAMQSYFNQLRLAGQELAGAPQTAAWRSARDQFQKAETKPNDVIVTQLRNAGKPAAAAQVLALQEQFAKDRAAIDARLKTSQPGQPNGSNPAPLPSGAQPGSGTP